MTSNPVTWRLPNRASLDSREHDKSNCSCAPLWNHRSMCNTSVVADVKGWFKTNWKDIEYYIHNIIYLKKSGRGTLPSFWRHLAVPSTGRGGLPRSRHHKDWIRLRECCQQFLFSHKPELSALGEQRFPFWLVQTFPWQASWGPFHNSKKGSSERGKNRQGKTKTKTNMLRNVIWDCRWKALSKMWRGSCSCTHLRVSELPNSKQPSLTCDTCEQHTTGILSSLHLHHTFCSARRDPANLALERARGNKLIGLPLDVLIWVCKDHSAVLLI